MLNWINDRFYFLLLLSDLLLTQLALGLANALRHTVELGKSIGSAQIYTTVDVWLVVPVFWFVAFRIARVYQREVLGNRTAETRGVLAGIALGSVILGCFFYLTYRHEFSRLLLIYFVLLDAIFLLALRLLAYTLWNSPLAHRYLARRLLIVGCASLGQRVARQLNNGSPYGLQVLGFVADGTERLRGGGELAFPLLGSYQDLHQIVRQQKVDGVVITTSQARNGIVAEVAAAVRPFGITVQIAAEALWKPGTYLPLERIHDIDLVAIQGPVLSLLDRVEKRIMDVLGASICLILSLPLIPCIALAIVLDSPGPVFFVQERIGVNGRPFKLFKFRSMVVGAEKLLPGLINLDQLDQPVFKIRDDPRVTRVGRFLRRTGLDEIPQLLNVLRGQMALVGPRPEEWRVAERYDYWHRQRWLVKPGMTGPMQIGGRGELGLDARVCLELEYIRNYSLLEDLRIVLATIPAVLSGRGAF